MSEELTEIETGKVSSPVNTKNRLSAPACLLCLLLITAIVFYRVMHQDFVLWDDQLHVLENPHLNTINFASIKYFWTHAYASLYIPVSYTVFAILKSIATLQHFDPELTHLKYAINPRVFHTFNYALHLANVALVFLILRMIVRKDIPAMLGALIFAIHPMQVESVAWISELRGLLAGFFCLASVYAYLKSARSDKRAIHITGYILSIIFSLFAILSKPSAVAIPLAILVLDLWILRRTLVDSLIRLVPFIIMCVLLVIKTHTAQPVNPILDTNVPTRVIVAGDALSFYIGKFFWPFNLTIDYARSPMNVMHHAWGHYTWLLAVVVIVLIGLAGRSRPLLIAAGLLSFAFILPELGFIPFGYQGYSTVADRYIYLSMIGPALAVAYWLASVKSPVPYSIVAAALIFFAILTMGQVKIWDNSLTLFRNAVAHNSTGFDVFNNYGVALSDYGDYAGAITEYQNALKINPGDGRTTSNLGFAFSQVGRTDEAIATLKHAIELEPKLPSPYFNLGVIYKDRHMPTESIEEFSKAIRANPYNTAAYVTAGDVFLEQHRYTDALKAYDQAISIDPTLGEAFDHRADALVKLKRPAEAEQDYRRAIRFNPNGAGLHTNLASLLQDTNRPDEAIAEYRAALSIDPNLADAHYNLGFVLLHNGNTADALTELREAVRLEPASADYHSELGTALAVSGDLPSAADELQTALKISPNLPEAKKTLALVLGAEKKK